MSDSDWEHVKEIVADVLEREPGERAAFLDHACDDAAVRARVEVLIGLETDARSFLETPAPVAERLRAAAPEGFAGRRIGAFRITRLIGAGGMGAVYEATQDHPRRTVAVKVMLGGLFTPGERRRFEREVQVLGRLRHPGIAQVYEAGMHEGDSAHGAVPFFAMELVAGARPIIDYADEAELDRRQRLELFLQVCDAVSHGHQRGVIHRDLKPGNILVDPSGRAKVIDFGVARATDADVTLTTLQTDPGQLIGTLAYMSPEQCEADPAEIDTRSDVYALGVILYELLCDRLPYDVRRRSITQALRLIQEQPPTRPSVVREDLRGDLETILLTTLDKDRDRRYASVGELAADIRRYLAHEPIDARPPSMSHQLRLFTRRHQGLVAGLGAASITLVAATAVSIGFAVQAVRAKADAESQRDAAQAVTAFLQQTLGSADPYVALGEEVSVRQALDEASRRIETELTGRPLVEAAVRDTIGNTYRNLGDYDAAERHLTTALALRRETLGSGHADVATSIDHLGLLRQSSGDYPAARRHFEEALATRRGSLGNEHADVATSLDHLGGLLTVECRFDEAQDVLREAIAIRRKTALAGDRPMADTMVGLATTMISTGDDLAGADALLREALAIQRANYAGDHPDVGHTLNVLGIVASRRGSPAAAEAFYRESLDVNRALFGDDHPHIAHSTNNVASVLNKQGKHGAALPYWRETVRIHRLHVGDEHAFVASSLTGLAEALEREGQSEEAESCLREALAIVRAGMGPGHPLLIKTLLRLGELLMTRGDWAGAEPLLHECLALQRKRRPEGDASVTRIRRVLETCLREQGRDVEAALIIGGG